MIIRRLGLQDVDVAIGAVVAVKPEHERGGLAPGVAHMRRLLADDRTYLIAALEHDEPVGFLLANRFPCADRDASVVYLQDVHVIRRARGQRVATRMIALLTRLCRGVPVLEFRGAAAEDNRPARRLLEAIGAEQVGTACLEYVYRPRRPGDK